MADGGVVRSRSDEVRAGGKGQGGGAACIDIPSAVGSSPQQPSALHGRHGRVGVARTSQRRQHRSAAAHGQKRGRHGDSAVGGKLCARQRPPGCFLTDSASHTSPRRPPRPPPRVHKSSRPRAPSRERGNPPDHDRYDGDGLTRHVHKPPPSKRLPQAADKTAHQRRGPPAAVAERGRRAQPTKGRQPGVGHRQARGAAVKPRTPAADVAGAPTTGPVPLGLPLCAECCCHPLPRRGRSVTFWPSALFFLARPRMCMGLRCVTLNAYKGRCQL